VEPQSSHWVNLDHDHLTGTGDSALLHALETYYDEWRQLGSPHIQDFTITFVPMAEASGGTLAEAQWSVEGRYYTRIFALARQKTTGTQNQE
jgi:hypothetical protein